MATTDTELKKLNKTVEDAVNVLKMYVGSSAQARTMNEKQREAINKWFDVNTQAEETQKRQRAFTERARDAQGRFIKKQEDSANKFMNMANSVGAMFGNMTKSFKTSISNFTQGITSHLSNFFQAVKSQFLGLFGEESEWFELLGSIKDSFKGFVGSISRGFMAIFRRTPAWAGKMIKTLKDIYKLQLKQMKMDFLGGVQGKKKGSPWTILGAILFTIAAGVGAWLHRKLVFLSNLPIFRKISTMFSTIDDIPFLGKIIKGLKFGFKWLGWPLTLLLSVIDFFKGFSETQGTLWEKIKEGLWKVWKGFFELPVRFVGWIVETVAGWMGIKVKGVGDTLMNLFEWYIKSLLDLPLTIGKFIGNAITSIQSFFTSFWDSIVQWMISKVPHWVPGSEKMVQTLKGMAFNETAVSEVSPAETVADMEKRKIEEQKKQAEEFAKIMSAFGESVDANNRKTDQTIKSITSMQANNMGGGADVQQIPDELDNTVLSIKNHGGEFD